MNDEHRDDTTDASLSRRHVLRMTTAAAVGLTAARWGLAQPAAAPPGDDGYLNVHRVPDEVTVTFDDGSSAGTRVGDDGWRAGAAEVTTAVGADAVDVRLRAAKPVRSVALRWRGGAPKSWTRVLHDGWERGYGDLSWEVPKADRHYPWYVMASVSGEANAPAHGFGVRTRPSALSSWTIDDDGVTLHCDVRAGGVGVELGERELTLCSVVSRRGVDGESAFAATHAFCKLMSPKPRLADHVVYGFNDWYYAYGRQTPANLVEDSKFLGQLTAGVANRPYSVMDDGWQSKTQGVKGGQWSVGRPTFPDMKQFAAEIKGANTRPGLWFRPLLDELKSWPDEWKLSRDKNHLDPSRPEVLEQVVAADTRRLVHDWGFELIKHDFSTIDILGRWGKDMRGQITDDGWSFAKRDRTTAEVINGFYDAIRNAAGDGAIVIGCNTMSHLSAGVFELQRIGDDTNDQDWERTVKMGVNALAFRAAQENVFYGADADCVGITGRTDWKRTKQWLDLASQSGTPLFVSTKRDTLNDEQRNALRDAMRLASDRLPLCEPIDWMTTRTPTKWKLNGAERTFDWA